MQRTAIEWCDLTSNPLKFRDAKTNQIVWGCVKTSPGCLHCYSETLALRYKQGKLFNAANMRELKPFMCDDELHKIATAKKVSGVEVTGKRCFVGDMTDLFGEWVTDQMLDSLFRTMVSRKDITFQLLTKRAEGMRKYCSDRWGTFGGKEWPLSENIWLGVSVEDQKRADERIPLLLQTPAAVRFLSCEPLLGPIDLQRSCALTCPNRGKGCLMGDKRTERLIAQSDEGGIIQECICSRMNGLRWAIVGGESGPGARPCNIEWIRDIVRQCKVASVPCFVKQLGSLPMLEECKETVPEKIMAHGRDWPEGTHFGNQTGDRAWNGRQILLHDKKGGNPTEWPADLRVREFPTLRAQCPTN